MPRCGATTDENHVAQTALSAVCGFSSPNCPTAADLPEMQEVCATRSYFHRSFSCRVAAPRPMKIIVHRPGFSLRSHPCSCRPADRVLRGFFNNLGPIFIGASGSRGWGEGDFERNIQLSGTLTEEQRLRLLEIANKCPVHRTPTGEINIQTQFVSIQPARSPVSLPQQARSGHHLLQLSRRDFGSIHRPARESPEPAIRIQKNALGW